MNRLAALQEQMNDFAVIVLATAQQATDGFQDFVVLRVLRGDSPAMLHLKLAGRLADVGRLHLLMLEPFPETGASPMPLVSAEPGDGWADETTPSALVAAAEAQMFTSTVPGGVHVRGRHGRRARAARGHRPGRRDAAVSGGLLSPDGVAATSATPSPRFCT